MPHSSTVPPDQLNPKHYLERAETLSQRLGSKRQPGDEKSFTDAMLSLMRSDGLLSVVVPTDFGGPGLNLEMTARITERIARQSGSAGLIYAMHMSQVMSVVKHGEGAFFEDLQRRIVTEQLLIASGTSEKGPGGDIFTSIATVALGAEGNITGAKESPNISYLDHAGLVLLTANMVQPTGKMRQVLIALDMKAVNVTVPYKSSFMGMRGILNQPVALQFTAPSAAVFHEPFAPIARRTMTPGIQILWASLWSGIAWAALARVKTFVREELSKDADVAQGARLELSSLINKHHAMNCLIRAAIASYSTDSGTASIGFSTAAQINRLKICCADWLNEICMGALRVIGLRGYATAGPYTLAEIMTDALSAPIMVSNTRLQINTAAIEDYVDEAL
jgi:acyl-CoA dehydrogenase